MNKFDPIRSKKNKEKIVCLTAYSHSIAKIIDKYCDIILVGDSLAMTVYGHENTQNVSLETMINHGKAVTNARKNSFVVIDLPFGTYEDSNELALDSAKKVTLATNCDAIKIEISSLSLIQRIKYLVQNGINVVSHVGLLPQQVKNVNGYKYQGLTKDSYDEILQLARLSDEAGAIAIVIEAVPEKLASEITLKTKIPTIGIGASINCDGQILVTDDLIGLNQDFQPKFVKRYSNVAAAIEGAVKNYAHEVVNQKFPSPSHLKQYKINP